MFLLRRKPDPRDTTARPLTLLANSSADRARRTTSPTGERQPLRFSLTPRNPTPETPTVVSPLSRRVPRLGRGCRESVITTPPAVFASMVGKKSTDNMAPWTPEEDRNILQLFALEARPPSKRHHSRPSI